MGIYGFQENIPGGFSRSGKLVWDVNTQQVFLQHQPKNCFLVGAGGGANGFQ